MPRCPLVLVLFALLAAPLPVLAQQFVEQAGAMPGPVVWSEGIEAFDANGDGWLDLIVTNGNGFNSATGALAPTLLINQGVPGTATFANESATRLPAGLVQQGKALCTCDVDGDGDEDIVFGNAFVTQPRVLINDGTGVFTDETATRFPTVNLNCFGVNFGDLDDDGDLDLVFSDVGASMGGSGGLARLFLNDGTGIFTDSPAKMNAVLKVAAMQVNIVDVDDDFDLDVIVDGKSAGQQLYLNDSDANFTFMGSVLPAGGSSVYETDWADLDGDGDIDGAYVSMSGFNEGIAENLLDAGSLAYTGGTGYISGFNGNDDNETAFLDVDGDGDLDLIVASLGNAREKLYINDGLMTTGSFASTTGFSIASDSTLDLTIGDLDNDGDADVATAQGESGSFLNRLYINGGAADALAPVIGRITEATTVDLGSFAGGGHAVRAWIQDGSYDNGKIWIGATLVGTVTKGATTLPFSAPMTHVGGGMFRGLVPSLPVPGGMLGATVAWHVEATDRAGNLAVGAPTSFLVCGSEAYGPATGVNGLALSLAAPATVGEVAMVEVDQGAPFQGGAVIAAIDAIAVPLVGGTLLVDPAAPAILPIFTDAAGHAEAFVLIPASTAWIGAEAVAQAILEDPSQPFGYRLSHGLRIVICGEPVQPPSIDAVTPLVAAAGATVTVTGSAFQIGVTVLLDGVPVPLLSSSDTTITFAMPAGLGCDLTLDVVNPDGQTATTPFNPGPVITSTNNSGGPSAGGALYILMGQGFGTGTTVTIGGAPAQILGTTATTVVTFTPAGTAGAATVVVTNAAGCQATTTYTYF